MHKNMLKSVKQAPLDFFCYQDNKLTKKLFTYDRHAQLCCYNS